MLGRYGSGVDPYDAKDDDNHPQFADVTDLNFTYQVVNATHPGNAPGSHVVAAGDTLQSIAKQQYGDAAYWYQIALANGLDAGSALTVGRKLDLPTITGTAWDRADSFRPYDPSTVIGDTAPTLPPPDDGCGILQIIVIIVAVVVTIYTAGATASALGATGTAAGGTSLASIGTAALTGGALTGAGAAVGVVSAVVGGLVGSIVSQGLAVALGIQKDINWSGVALSGLGAGISSGLGASGLVAGETFAPTVTRAVLANAITQGIGVVTGLQDHFSWTGVAAAGVGAAASYGVGEALGMHAPEFVNAGFGERLVKGTIAGIAGGAAAALARGGRVTVQQVATDAFGNALGSGLVDAMQTPSGSADQYSLAYGMRSSLGLKADATVWNGGADGSYGSYQPEDLSLTANGVPSLPMQMGDAASDGYNPAADPEVQARTQRFLAMNPMASNDVVDPSLSKTLMDEGGSASVLQLSTGSLDGVDAKRSPEDEVATTMAMREAAQLQRIRDDVDALNTLKVYAAMGRGEDLAPTVENAARLGLYDTSGDGVPVRFSDSMPKGNSPIPGAAPTVQMVERPTYDAMGNVTGTEYVPIDNKPTMSYVGQMRNTLAATGQLAFGGLKGVVNGGPELITTVGKGWAYLTTFAGEASGILRDGATDRTIAALDSKTGRVFEYDNGLQSMGGIAGGMVSPGAYARGAELGIAGLRALGPHVAITAENFLIRQGLLLRVRDEAPLNENQIFKYEAAPYHGTIDNAVKSRAPLNAQAALDSSVQVKITSPRRVGVDMENQEFVVFDRTRENVYHGHVRSWSDLHPDMQRALQRAGMVDRRGNILGK